VFPKGKIFYLGNTAKIYGSKEDDGNAVDNLINLIEDQNPTAIILGGLS
jgi:hypothetical protein